LADPQPAVGVARSGRAGGEVRASFWRGPVAIGEALKSWSELRLGRKAPEVAIAELPLSGNGSGTRLRLREPVAAPALASAAKRRVLQPLPVAGVLLVLVALVGYLAVYSQTTRRTSVLVAARSLPAGSVLRAADLRSTGLAGDRAVIGALLPSRELALALGRRLATPVPAGMPLARSVLAAPTPVPSAFTVVVPVLHALGGALHPGDRVSVLATFQAAAGGAQTRAVARDLQVLAVGQAPSGLYQASATIPVTLALPNPSLASALALAEEAGKIDLLREGAGAGAPIPSVSAGG
jgi:Flp pilus assembly protein CpaB